VVLHTCNPRTKEMEVGGSKFWSQIWLQTYSVYLSPRTISVSRFLHWIPPEANLKKVVCLGNAGNIKNCDGDAGSTKCSQGGEEIGVLLWWWSRWKLPRTVSREIWQSQVNF
jgi:hypothetical protein